MIENLNFLSTLRSSSECLGLTKSTEWDSGLRFFKGNVLTLWTLSIQIVNMIIIVGSPVLTLRVSKVVLF